MAKEVLVVYNCLGMDVRGLFDAEKIDGVFEQAKREHELWHSRWSTPMCTFELGHWDTTLGHFVPGEALDP